MNEYRKRPLTMSIKMGERLIDYLVVAGAATGIALIVNYLRGVL